jgi:shikimate kinase
MMFHHQLKLTALSTKIFLIGMPASGKSTLGKEISELIKLKFFDLDNEIVKHENRSIPQIFDEKGEGHFRDVEHKCLSRIIDNNDSFVMATGGGAPCRTENMTKMLNHGKVIFLDVPVDELLKRLNNQELSSRPKLNNQDLETTLLETIKIRLVDYQKAHHIVSGDAITAKQIIAHGFPKGITMRKP